MTSVTISRSFTKLLSGSHSKKNARIKKKKNKKPTVFYISLSN